MPLSPDLCTARNRTEVGRIDKSVLISIHRARNEAFIVVVSGEEWTKDGGGAIYISPRCKCRNDGRASRLMWPYVCARPRFRDLRRAKSRRLRNLISSSCLSFRRHRPCSILKSARCGHTKNAWEHRECGAGDPARNLNENSGNFSKRREHH